MHVPEQLPVRPIMHDKNAPAEISSWRQRLSQLPVAGRVVKLLTWWLIFSGIYASSSVCPCCGQVGCPVGAAGAGIVGGLFALVIGKGKVVIEPVIRGLFFIRSMFSIQQEGKP
jgi:hypothetical protein